MYVVCTVMKYSIHNAYAWDIGFVDVNISTQFTFIRNMVAGRLKDTHGKNVDKQTNKRNKDENQRVKTINEHQKTINEHHKLKIVQ